MKTADRLTSKTTLSVNTSLLSIKNKSCTVQLMPEQPAHMSSDAHDLACSNVTSNFKYLCNLCKSSTSMKRGRWQRHRYGWPESGGCAKRFNEHKYKSSQSIPLYGLCRMYRPIYCYDVRRRDPTALTARQ